jgi:hypothetical protein
MRGHRLIVFVCVAAAVSATVIGLRPYATARIQERLRGKYDQRLAELPPQQAVLLLQQLSTTPELSLPALVASLADERPTVRKAGTAEIHALVQRVSSLPIPERSIQARKLAAELARHAPRMPPSSRAIAHEIARAALGWPLDGRAIEISRVIADCEQVLALPCEEPHELRVADARGEPVRLTTPPAASLSDE